MVNVVLWIHDLKTDRFLAHKCWRSFGTLIPLENIEAGKAKHRFQRSSLGNGQEMLWFSTREFPRRIVQCVRMITVSGDINPQDFLGA